MKVADVDHRVSHLLIVFCMGVIFGIGVFAVLAIYTFPETCSFSSLMRPTQGATQ